MLHEVHCIGREYNTNNGWLLVSHLSPFYVTSSLFAPSAYLRLSVAPFLRNPKQTTNSPPPTTTTHRTPPAYSTVPALPSKLVSLSYQQWSCRLPLRCPLVSIDVTLYVWSWDARDSRNHPASSLSITCQCIERRWMMLCRCHSEGTQRAYSIQLQYRRWTAYCR